MKLMKHIGRMTNTDQRVIVVYMSIPGAENFALIAPADAMPPVLEQAVMEILESNEGQNCRNLADVLGRRLLQETGKSVLETMHLRGYLTRISVDNITMYPAPNMPVPLKGLLTKMNGAEPNTLTAEELPTERFNPHANNITAATDENNVGIASNLLVEASMLEADARAKREQAFAYAPHLRPKANRKAQAAAPAPVPAAKADTPPPEGD